MSESKKLTVDDWTPEHLTSLKAFTLDELYELQKRFERHTGRVKYTIDERGKEADREAKAVRERLLGGSWATVAWILGCDEAEARLRVEAITARVRDDGDDGAASVPVA